MTPDASDVHLAARGVRCARGGREVLRDVELEVDRGETVGVVGPNGAGKSSLLRVLAGVRPPAAGEVLLDGRPLGERSPRRRAREVAFVGQEEELPADMLVGELVALGRTPHRPPWASGGVDERAAVARALRAVDLEGFAGRPVDRLSGGERRRVLLARGLAQESPLLLLDEPTNHLDVRHELALLRLVRDLGRTVVLAMHDLNLAASVCDRLVLLHAGHQAAAGPPDAVLDPGTVEHVFGVRATVVHHPRTGARHLIFDDLPDPEPR